MDYVKQYGLEIFLTHCVFHMHKEIVCATAFYTVNYAGLKEPWVVLFLF